MSISTIQRKRKTNEFAKYLIQKGVEPNNFELNKMLTEFFDNHILGMPFYAPKKQTPYDTSSKEDYNYNFSILNEDINVMYDANIETNNKAVSLQEYYDTEKDKINNTIDKLTQRVDNLSEALNSSLKIQEYVEVFDDLYKIEFYGNKERNIPATTSFIDLLQKRVYTEKSNSQVNRLSLKGAIVTLDGKSSFKEYEMKGKISDILSDIITDTFTFVGYSTLNTPKTISFTVDIGKLVNINSIFLSYTSSRGMKCSLAISDNGNDFYSVYDVNARGHIEWNFTERPVRYFKISCTKPEADGVSYSSSTASMYEYYYVFKNAYVALESYQEKSILVTKPITFRNLTNKLCLNATDMVFSNTRIDYFIGYDNKTGRIGWDSIENHKDHDLVMFDKHSKIANYGTYASFGAQSIETGLYEIFKLPNGTNVNSLKVTPGYNMWSVKRFVHHDADNLGFSLNDMDYTDFVNNSEFTQLFMDCENYNNFEVQPNVLYIFTQYINIDEYKNIYDKFISIMTSSYEEKRDFQLRIFVNGYECTASDTGLYSFRFKKGTNKVQMAIYFPYEVNSELYYGTLVHNINFKEITNNIFAFPPMRYTESNILSRNMEDNYEYYTIRNNTVYVKCNPSALINRPKNDMGYFLSYYSLKPDMQNYFDEDKLTFRIMAVLSSTDKNMSPSIQSIRITGK